jgi:hypothetical protein
MEANGSGKHSGLLRYDNNYDRKKFLCAASGARVKKGFTYNSKNICNVTFNVLNVLMF